MDSADFVEQALSKNYDRNALKAEVESLENYLTNCNNNTSSSNTFNGQKYKDQSDGEIGNFSCQPSIVSSAPFTTFILHKNLALSDPSNRELLKTMSTKVQNLPVSDSNTPFTVRSITNRCVNISSAQAQVAQTVQDNTIVPHSGRKTTTQPPLVIKQGTTSGQFRMEAINATLPMAVNSSMPGSIPNIMTINKPGRQNVFVTTQNLGSAQPAILPNAQILNMRPGATAVAGTSRHHVATASPRIAIGTPQVAWTRAATQTFQSLQQGQQGHSLLKTENGQYQLLRVGPAPANSTVTSQTLRLSTVPAHPGATPGVHPGMATGSTSVASSNQMAGQMPAGPVFSSISALAPQPGVAMTNLPMQKPPPKAGSKVVILQNIPVYTKLNVTKVGKTMPVNSKSGFTRPVLTVRKSVLKKKDKELEELRQQEANLTALQAISGPPRKKPRLDGPGGARDSALSLSSHGYGEFSGRSQIAPRTCRKRREQERKTAESQMLFWSYPK